MTVQHTTIPATTQQAMQSAIGSIKRAASATGRAATPAAMKAARIELQHAIDKLHMAHQDFSTLEAASDR